MKYLTLLALLAGCSPSTALVGGRLVPRLDLGYSDGRYYAVTHRRAWPEHRGPSGGLDGYGGAIAGKVCGVNLFLEAEHEGDHLAINGFFDGRQVGGSSATDGQNPLSVWIEVRDRVEKDQGLRQFSGALGIAMSEPVSPTLVQFLARGANPASVGLIAGGMSRRSPVMELALSPERLRGRVGRRRFDLVARGDSYVGTVEIVGRRVPFTLSGRGDLWSMPAADQAVILPLMLTCSFTSTGGATAPMLEVAIKSRPGG